MDDICCVCEREFYDKVITSVRKCVQICLEDTNYVLFVRQRVCWTTEGPATCIQVDPERTIEEFGEIVFGKHLKDINVRSAALHSQFPYVLGKVNWLQPRTYYKRVAVDHAVRLRLPDQHLLMLEHYISWSEPFESSLVFCGVGH